MQKLEMFDIMQVVKRKKDNQRLKKHLEECKNGFHSTVQPTPAHGVNSNGHSSAQRLDVWTGCKFLCSLPPNKNGNSSVTKLILFWHNVFVVKLKFWISRKVSVPTASLWTSRLWGCTHLESTLAPTTTAPGVGIPNHRLEKGAGTGWWCWRQATNFPTMSAVTPAWALSSLAWANQVETFLATGTYHRWFYEPGCNNGAVHILDSRNSNIVRILKHNILTQKVDFFLHQTHLQWQARQPKLPMLLYKLLLMGFSEWLMLQPHMLNHWKSQKLSILFYLYRLI